MTERAEIYRCIPPEGLRMPIMVMSAVVDDGVTEKAYIEQVVRGLKGGRETGPSGMQAEDLKGWLREALRRITQ